MEFRLVTTLLTTKTIGTDRYLAEMVARATERAIFTDAVSITVKSADGAVQKYQVLEGRTLVKKGRKGR